MRALATFCYRRRRLVLAFWLDGFVGVTLVGKSVGSAYSNSFDLPSTESTRALKLLQAEARKQSDDTEQVVVGTTGGTLVTDPAVEARVNTMLARVAALPHVGAAFVEAAETASGGNVRVAVAGQLANRAERQGIGGAGVGILAAGVVLFVAFGSLLAVALPLAAALVSLGTAVAAVSLLSQGLKLPQSSGQLILLIGRPPLGYSRQSSSGGGSDRCSASTAGARRSIPAGDAVRHPLRAVHGLRGLPRLTYPHGVAPHS